MASIYTYELVVNGCRGTIPQGSNICDYYVHKICTTASVPMATRITATEVNVATGAKKRLWAQDLVVQTCATFSIDTMPQKYPASQQGLFRIEVQLTNLCNPVDVSDVKSFTVIVGQCALDAHSRERQQGHGEIH